MPFSSRPSTARSLWLLALAGAVAVAAATGCSGSKEGAMNVNYDSSLDSTTYTAGPIAIQSEDRPQMRDETSVTGSATERRRRRRRRRAMVQRIPTLLVEAYGRCQGQKCTPQEVDVILRAKEPFMRPGPSVTMQMSGRTYTWEQPSAVTPGPGEYRYVLATVTLSWTQFQELAQSQIVTIQLDDKTFESSYDQRATLRRLAAEAGV